MLSACSTSLFIVFAHHVDDCVGNLCQEGLLKADFCCQKRRARRITMRGIAARPLAPGNMPSLIRKNGRPNMIRNHAVGNDVRVPLFVGMTGKLLGSFDNRHKEVGLIGWRLLPATPIRCVQPHTGIYPGRRQRFVPLPAVFGVGLLAVELHKDQVPYFQESVVFHLQHGYNAVSPICGLLSQ